MPIGGATRPLGEVLERALEQNERSPMPAGERPSLLATFGEEGLSLLLGISTSSVRRYAAGTRATPQDVADRLHVLALVVADLGGAPVGGYDGLRASPAAWSRSGVAVQLARRSRASADRLPGSAL